MFKVTNLYWRMVAYLHMIENVTKYTQHTVN